MNRKNIFFAILILFVLCISCKKNIDITSSSYSNDAVTWLKNDSNYANKKNYQAQFLKEYHLQLQDKKYENAKWLLYYYGNVLFAKDYNDSVFTKTTVDFLVKDFPIKKDTILSWNYYFLADQYEKISDFNAAIFYEKKSLDINPDKNSNIYLKTLNALGTSHSLMFQNEKAIPYLVRALPLAEKSKNYNEMGALYNNIAYAYGEVFAFEESKKNYQKSAYYFLKAKDTSNYFALQTTFAYNHFNISRDTLQTIKLIDSVFTVYNKFKDPVEMDISTADFTKAFKYFLLKDYDNALDYLDKSSAFYIKTNNLDFLKYNNSLKIQIKFAKDKTLQDKDEAEQLAKDLFEEESFNESMDLYDILYQNELKNNNIPQALIYRNKASEIEKKLLDSNQKGQLFEIEQKYQSEKKEKIITEQKNILAKNKLYLIILFVTLLALILATILFFMKRKKTEMIEKNKRQELFTFQLLQNTEEERNRIANELHDSVNHDLLNIKNTLINGKNIEVNTVENVIEEVRNISRNLHPAVLQNLGFEASIIALCERVTNETSLFVTCDIEYDKKLGNAKELQLYRIIQEALNNTIKHGKAKAAKVIVTSSASILHLEIKDNGNGFNVKEQLNSSKSFGLQSILQRAKAIAAIINIESTKEGTKISLNINLK